MFNLENTLSVFISNLIYIVSYQHLVQFLLWCVHLISCFPLSVLTISVMFSALLCKLDFDWFAAWAKKLLWSPRKKWAALQMSSPPRLPFHSVHVLLSFFLLTVSVSQECFHSGERVSALEALYLAHSQVTPSVSFSGLSF